MMESRLLPLKVAMQLVSFKFTGENFGDWKKSMVITLSAKNKAGFVTGAIEEPTPNTAEHEAWERCTNLVKSWLLYNLDPKIAKSVLSFRTASEIWDDLTERFGSTSMTQVFNLEKQLNELTQGTLTVAEFYTAIKTIWDSLDDTDPLPYCTCGMCTCNLTKRIVDREQAHRVVKFMMKLNAHFATIRGNVLMMKPFPKCSEAYRYFSEEEIHKETTQDSTTVESMAFVANRKNTEGVRQNSWTRNENVWNRNENTWLRNQNSWNRNDATKTNRNGTYIPQQRQNTWNRNNPPVNTNTFKRPGSSYYCTYCKIPGHSYERCFKVHGFPPGFKNGQGNRVVAASVQQGMTEESTVKEEEQPVAGFTTDQLNSLMQYINKQQLTQAENNTGMHILSEPQAHLAGNSGDEVLA